jgi:Cu/Ag efflux pump CusA
VRGTADAGGSPELIRALRVPVAAGGTVPLRAVADVTIAPAMSEVTREGGSRKIDVTCNVSGRDLGSIAQSCLS